ncbi:MAG: universal stress protein [Deltaproteobacteria bacterium]|jgi:nucleotide-binding universal stress UspA family protein|nr:universal stress protein [Deltaproteobacteria bacterium]
MKSSFYLAKKKLIGCGFKPKSISTKILMGKSSRAKAIADEARQYDFGTIVMGRKGRSRVREFFIGRVTNKVIHMARDRSVWIIP